MITRKEYIKRLLGGAVGLVGLGSLVNADTYVRHDSSNYLKVGVGKTTIPNDLKIDQHAYFDGEYANTVSASACTVDWGMGNKQKLTLDDDCEVTFTAPDGVGNFLLKVVQDDSGGHALTFATSIKWADGTEPTYTTDANAIDIITFYYDGSSYHGVCNTAFATA